LGHRSAHSKRKSVQDTRDGGEERGLEGLNVLQQSQRISGKVADSAARIKYHQFDDALINVGEREVGNDGAISQCQALQEGDGGRDEIVVGEQSAFWYISRAGCIADCGDVIRSWKSWFDTVLFALFFHYLGGLGNFLQMYGEKGVLSVIYRSSTLCCFAHAEATR